VESRTDRQLLDARIRTSRSTRHPLKPTKIDGGSGLSGALIGAAAGAWVSARLAYKQQSVSAQLADGQAAIVLERSAADFASNADTIGRLFWALIVCAVAVYGLRWLYERRA
jgi:hypothetical protein